jgi:hypothetical protein
MLRGVIIVAVRGFGVASQILLPSGRPVLWFELPPSNRSRTRSAMRRIGEAKDNVVHIVAPERIVHAGTATERGKLRT